MSEGGLITTIAEMAFSMKAGVEIDAFFSKEQLFAETPGCIVVEVESTEVDDFQALFGDDAQQIGKTTSAHKKLVIADQIEEDLTSLKERWQHGLTPYY